MTVEVAMRIRDYGHGIIDPVTTGQSLGVVAGA
jgi:hypothetical protein